ncbi:hypothetical protein ACN4EG_24350 [Alkalinema pantanalense CENA528]|uniref:hypothetical protein n=1 Tax=Alkalinema pantanalense TaxID=1620705 RepID=UPI003D6E97DF
MHTASVCVRSLVLAMIVSFLVPVLLVSAFLLLLMGLGFLPGLGNCSHAFLSEVLSFLSTFGEGHPWMGLVTIGFAFSLVGVLFDSYILYRQRFLT